MTPHQPAAEAHDMSGAHLPTCEELTAPREVAAGGLYNMRDLGRLPRRDGGHTRSGIDTPGLPVVRDERAYQRAFCPPELMPILLHWLRTCYGGVERYLRRHCGLTGDEIGVLRDKLAA